MKPVKFLAIGLTLVLIVNMILVALGIIGTLSFFIVLIVIGIVAFKGIPYIKKK